jgi:hypothetical protein
MRTSIASVASVAFVVVVTSLGSCLPKGASAAPTPFRDDFARAELGAHYKKTGGSWRILEGALHTMGDRNQPLWLDVPLARNTRVEFTTTSHSPSVDTKIEIFGDGVRHESGYIVIFGGWKNTITTIAKKDEHEPTRKEVKRGGERDRTYRWRVQRTDGKTLELFIDDALVVSYVDEAPLFGPGNDRLAFTSWESEVRYDDLVITPLP